MHQRGELRTYLGRVTPVDQFMADVAADLAGVKVVAGACDSYKDAEAQDFLERAGLHWPVKFRRVGAGKDGGADVRALQCLVLNGKLRWERPFEPLPTPWASTLRQSGKRWSAVSNQALRLTSDVWLRPTMPTEARESACCWTCRRPWLSMRRTFIRTVAGLRKRRSLM